MNDWLAKRAATCSRRIANTRPLFASAEERCAGVVKVKSCRFGSGRDKQPANTPAAEIITTNRAGHRSTSLRLNAPSLPDMLRFGCLKSNYSATDPPSDMLQCNGGLTLCQVALKFLQ